MDAAASRGWFEANVAAVEPPLEFERISGGRSNLTSGSPTPPAVAGRCAGRRSASAWRRPTTWAASTGSSRRSPTPRCRWRPPSGSARTSRSTARRSTSWMGRRADPALEGRRRGLPRPRRAASDRRARRRHLVVITRWTPTTSASATSRRRRTTSPASSIAGRASGRSRRPASCRWSTTFTTGSPPGSRTGPGDVVHGDYRLDNMNLTPRGEVAAVVDWELCTLGDPLADVGLLLVYWGDEGDELEPLLSRRRSRPGSRLAPRSVSSTPSVRPRPLRDRLLCRSRALEARDHPRGRLRPLRRRPYGEAEESARGHGGELVGPPTRPSAARPGPLLSGRRGCRVRSVERRCGAVVALGRRGTGGRSRQRGRNPTPSRTGDGARGVSSAIQGKMMCSRIAVRARFLIPVNPSPCRPRSALARSTVTEPVCAALHGAEGGAADVMFTAS